MTCDHGPARLHFFEQKFNYARLFLPEKLLSNGLKFNSKTQERSASVEETEQGEILRRGVELRRLHLRQGEEPLLNGALSSMMVPNVVETTLQMDFMVEILLLLPSFDVILHYFLQMLCTPRSTRC